MPDLSTSPRRDQRGQVLPLFALSAVVILALMGLGLDGARVFLERRDAQGAADLAALSAARLLPDESAARDMAVAVAAANGFTIDRNSDVTTPYKGSASRIHVNVPTNVQMLFTAVVGITDTPVNGSAAALHEEELLAGAAAPLSGPAILGAANLCGSSGDKSVIKWDGHRGTVYGDVISNSGYDLSGADLNFTGEETYRHVDGSCVNDFDPHANTPPEVDFQPTEDVYEYPILPTLLDAPSGADPVFEAGGICDKTVPSAYPRVWLKDGKSISNYYNGSQILDGVYCLGDNEISPTMIADKGNVGGDFGADMYCDFCTFIVPQFQVSAARVTISSPAIALTPDGSFCDMPDNTCAGYPLLVYANLTGDAVNLSGEDFRWTGLWLAPFGDTHFSGADGTNYEGAIWANTVEIPGADFTLSGPGYSEIFDVAGPGQPEYLGLIE